MSNNTKQRLNVVVGPNGTGKSTILCAICLGLGGQPPLLGRADDARLFIKHEKEQATIEIELAPRKAGGTVHILKRVIDRDRGSENGNGKGASTYYVNGTKTPLKSVKELVTEKYHINIDNLCTFLPQDKVGNFSGFDKQALLVETEKSLSKSLYNTHQSLIELEKELQSSGNDFKSLQDELKTLKKQNERLEREKELMEERQQILEKIDMLKKKRAWLLFDSKREEAKEAKEKREELKKQKREAERGLRPLQEKCAEMDGKVNQIQATTKALEVKARKERKNFDGCLTKMENHSDEIERVQGDYQTIDSQHRKAVRELERERQRLEQIEANGDDFPSMEEVDKTINEAAAGIRTAKSKLDKLKRSIRGKNEEIEKGNNEAQIAKDRLTKMKDEKKHRLNRLFSKNGQLKNAYEYISNNRKEFRKPIHGPIGKCFICILSFCYNSLSISESKRCVAIYHSIAAEVQPRNAQTASYLEQHVARATWQAFVVECKEDYELLYREVRVKRKIPINIIIVPNGKLEPIRRMYSDRKMNILKTEHGFHEYLDETCTAPDPIMAAMIAKHNIDKVLVGGDAVAHSLLTKGLEEFITTREDGNGNVAACYFYTDPKLKMTLKHTLSASRYSGRPGKNEDQIGPAKVLQSGIDPSEKERLVKTIADAKEIVERLTPDIEEYQAEYDKIHAHGQTLSVQQKEARRTKNDYGAYKMRLKNQRDKVRDAEEAASKDNDREKSRLIAQIKKLVQLSIKSGEDASKAYTEVLKSTKVITGVKMTEHGLSESLRKLK